MSVQNLDNRERGMNVQDRAAAQADNDEKNSAKTRAAIERTKKGGGSPADELEALRQRIEAARTMIAPPEERHCSECTQRWSNGRDATIKAIEG